MTDLENSNIEQVLETEGETITSILGLSMYPMLRNKQDVVVVEKLNRELKRYDVPLYRMPSGKLILHRILKVEEDRYIIRGDNTYSLEYIPKEYVIGVLKAFYRNGKMCDCATSKGYRVYIFFNMISYPLRYFWLYVVKKIGSKIKQFILRKILKRNP